MKTLIIDVLVDSASTGCRLLVNRSIYNALKKEHAWQDDHETSCAGVIMPASHLLIIELAPLPKKP